MTHPELWLARHGQTEWSVAGRHTGRTDLSLTPQGQTAAATLGEILAGEKFDLVLMSPLKRAVETCELAGFGDVALRADDLMEWDYGAYEGITTPEIRTTRPGWTAFGDGFPGGETLAQVAERADRIVARIRHVDSRALVFGHGHALRILAARWLGMDPRLGANLVLDTATISILGWERETPAIKSWNAT